MTDPDDTEAEVRRLSGDPEACATYCEDCETWFASGWHHHRSRRIEGSGETEEECLREMLKDLERWL